MTDGEKNYLASTIGVFIILFIVMAVLFSFTYSLGIVLVLGIFFYFMFFIYRDKRMKREELDKLLYVGESRMIYNKKLPIEVP